MKRLTDSIKFVKVGSPVYSQRSNEAYGRASSRHPDPIRRVDDPESAQNAQNAAHNGLDISTPG